ncbi:MAG: MFS transporter [Pseudomonadota bacterium]
MKKYSKYIYFLPWFICALGALFYAYEYFLRVTPSVMTSQLSDTFKIDEAGLGNLSACYYYVYTPMQLIVGVLMDRYGPRRLLTMATLCCVMGSILFAATDNLLIAGLGRIFIGFGSAFAFVGVLKLGTIWLPRRVFATYAGLATALGMLGAAFGENALTRLVYLVGWRETVFISAFFGVFLAALIGFYVRDQALDKHGKVIKSANLDFEQIITALIKIIKKPQMWFIGAVGALMYLGASAIAELWGNPYLEQAHGFTATQAAFASSLIFIGYAVGSPTVGWISDKIKRRTSPLAVCALIAAALFSVLIYVPHLAFASICLLMFLFGAFSGAQPLVFALGKELNSQKFAGSSLAFTNMAVMLSGVVLQPLIGYVLDKLWVGLHTPGGARLFDSHDWMIALSLVPICYVIAAIIAKFIVKETFCKAKESSIVERISTHRDNIAKFSAS